MLFLATLLSPFAIPFIQRALRRHRSRWSDILAAELMFLPGTAFVVVIPLYVIPLFDDRLTRVTIVSSYIAHGAEGAFTIFWLFTTIGLAIWAICEYAARRKATPENALPAFPNRVLLWQVPILFIVTGAAALYLFNYKTLEDAVRMGDVELARERLKFNLLGVDANTGCIGGISSMGTFTEPLLWLAAETGNIEMAELLLEHGADINHPAGRFCAAPVAAAAHKGHWPMVTYLVERGGKPGGAIGDAAAANEIEILKFLLDRGADPNCGIRAAAEHNAVDALRVLLDRSADPNSGIHAAAEHNAVDALRVLLDHGGDPHILDSRGATALDTAALAQADDAYELLASRGVQLRDLNGFISCSRLDLFERALKAGADPHGEYFAYDRGNKTPLAYAIYRGKPEFVEALMKAGVQPGPIKSRDTEPELPPLHLAVDQRSIECAKVLLRYGASVNLRERAGRTPLHVAAEDGTGEMVALLCEAGADVDTIVDADAIRSCQRGTPLLIALNREDSRCGLSVVRSLLDHGADPNLQYADETPILVAVRRLYVEAVPLLIERGADLNVTSSDGHSLLDLATGYYPGFLGDEQMEASLAITKVLVAAGADPWDAETYRDTPLRLAEQSGNTKVAEYLISTWPKSKGPLPAKLRQQDKQKRSGNRP